MISQAALSWRYFVYITMLGAGVILTPLIALDLIEDPILDFTKLRYQNCAASLKVIAKANKTEHQLSAACEII